MESGDLNNITITGNDANIMCNNSGGVYCGSCDNVVIGGSHGIGVVVLILQE